MRIYYSERRRENFEKRSILFLYRPRKPVDIWDGMTGADYRAILPARMVLLVAKRRKREVIIERILPNLRSSCLRVICWLLNSVGFNEAMS